MEPCTAPAGLHAGSALTASSLQASLRALLEGSRKPASAEAPPTAQPPAALALSTPALPPQLLPGSQWLEQPQQEQRHPMHLAGSAAIPVPASAPAASMPAASAAPAPAAAAARHVAASPASASMALGPMQQQTPLGLSPISLYPNSAGGKDGLELLSPSNLFGGPMASPTFQLSASPLAPPKPLPGPANNQHSLGAAPSREPTTATGSSTAVMPTSQRQLPIMPHADAAPVPVPPSTAGLQSGWHLGTGHCSSTAHGTALPLQPAAAGALPQPAAFQQRQMHFMVPVMTPAGGLGAAWQPAGNGGPAAFQLAPRLPFPFGPPAAAFAPAAFPFGLPPTIMQPALPIPQGSSMPVRFYPMANMPAPLNAPLEPSAPKKARRRASKNWAPKKKSKKGGPEGMAEESAPSTAAAGSQPAASSAAAPASAALPGSERPLGSVGIPAAAAAAAQAEDGPLLPSFCAEGERSVAEELLSPPQPALSQLLQAQGFGTQLAAPGVIRTGGGGLLFSPNLPLGSLLSPPHPLGMLADPLAGLGSPHALPASLPLMLLPQPQPPLAAPAPSTGGPAAASQQEQSSSGAGGSAAAVNQASQPVGAAAAVAAASAFATPAPAAMAAQERSTAKGAHALGPPATAEPARGRAGTKRPGQAAAEAAAKAGPEVEAASGAGSGLGSEKGRSASKPPRKRQRSMPSHNTQEASQGRPKARNKQQQQLGQELGQEQQQLEQHGKAPPQRKQVAKASKARADLPVKEEAAAQGPLASKGLPKAAGPLGGVAQRRKKTGVELEGQGRPAAASEPEAPSSVAAPASAAAAVDAALLQEMAAKIAADLSGSDVRPAASAAPASPRSARNTAAFSAPMPSAAPAKAAVEAAAAAVAAAAAAQQDAQEYSPAPPPQQPAGFRRRAAAMVASAAIAANAAEEQEGKQGGKRERQAAAQTERKARKTPASSAAGVKVTAPRKRLEGQLTRVQRSLCQIITHVGHRQGVFESEIRSKFGNNPDISKALRQLRDEEQMVRGGEGGRGTPFHYTLTSKGRAQLDSCRDKLAADAAAFSRLAAEQQQEDQEQE